MPGEKCISCSDSNIAAVTHCVICGGGLCAGHIFECRKCNKPMCHTCWKKAGKDLCPSCSGPGSGIAAPT
jgi:hypothetical protein